MRTIGKVLGRSRFAIVMGFAALGVLVVPTSAFAQPANDNFANATPVGSLPFTDTVDLTDATVEPGEPQPCFPFQQTAWYSFTPAATEVVRVDTTSTMLAPEYNLYRQAGSGFGGLTLVACSIAVNQDFFTAQAGTTYYIQVGALFGTGTLQLSLQVVAPPANDAFASATPVGPLPYSNSVDATAATTEPGEPIPACATPFNPIATVWYSFTPTVSETFSPTVDMAFSLPFIAAYTGSSLANLTEVGSVCLGERIFAVHLDAGTTYHFQVGGVTGSGPLTFGLDATPPPIAGLSFDPPDPSTFDTVQFFNQSNDPGGVGFQSSTWDFGDGTTISSSAGAVSHQYAKDGDYTVELTVTTVDGRTASTSQVVHVRTHDVSIAKFLTPTAASPGQTRTITVGINNTRYPETVQVQLFKSTANGFGFDPVGSLTQSVPASKGKATTAFNINYTFTSDDATLGKVSFEAVATIVGARDAFPADNTAISTPTKINH
jgi:hypothetical protein